MVCAVVTVVNSGQYVKKDPCSGLPHDTFIVNPKGCKYFFSCKNGTSVGAFCPHGLWFNPESGICDLPQHVVCHFDDPITSSSMKPTRTSRPPTSSTITTTSSSDLLSTTTVSLSTTPTSGVVTEQDEVLCPVHDANIIKFVASKINCHHYYICYHGRAMRQECSDGLHWNVKANKCDRATDAKCNVSEERLQPIGPNRFSRSIFVFVSIRFADHSETANAISQVPEQCQSVLSASNRMRILHILPKRFLFDTTVPVLPSLGCSHGVVQMASVHTLRSYQTT